MEWCAKVDSSGANGSDKSQCGMNKFSTRLRFRFDAIVASQGTIGDSALLTHGNMLSLALSHLEAMDDRLEECQDAKDAARKLVSQAGNEKNEFNQSASLFKYRFNELQVD